MFDSKVLNAIKLHLILINVANKACQKKLEELITQGGGNVSAFLNETYNRHRINRESYLMPLLSKINEIKLDPSNLDSLESFNLAECYLIAKLLGLSSKDLREFDALRLIGNRYYGHLQPLEIDESTYVMVLNNLKRIVEFLAKSDLKFLKEMRKEIEKIESIQDFSYMKRMTNFYLKSNIPYPKCSNLIKNIDSDLKYETSSQIVLLYGPPGIGKTTNAIDYAYRSIEESFGCNAIWFSFKRSSLKENISILLNYNDTKDPIDFIKNEINISKEKRFLFIFDDLKYIGEEIQRFLTDLPSNVKVLITSRNRNVLTEFRKINKQERGDTFLDLKIKNKLITISIKTTKLEVKHLSKEESLAFLKKSLLVELRKKDIDLLDSYFTKITNVLPYELNLLTRFLNENDDFLELEEFFKSNKSLDEDIIQDLFDEIEENSMTLLQCFSLIGSEAIPKFLGTRFLKLDDENSFDEIIDLLEKNSFIKVFNENGIDYLKISKYIQEIVKRIVQNDPDTFENVKFRVIETMYLEFPYVDNTEDENWNKAKVLLPHVLKIEKYTSDEKEIELNECIGRYYCYIKKDFSKGLEYFLKAKKIAGILSNDGKHTKTYSLKYKNLEKTCQEVSNLIEKEKDYRKVIEAKEAKTTQEMASGYFNLANILLKMNKFEESEIFFIKAKELYEKIYPNQTSQELAECLSQLALVYFGVNKFIESEKLNLKSIELFQSINQTELKQNMANSYSNLADVYYRTNRLKECIRFYMKSIEIKTLIFSNNINLDLAVSYMKLGNAYMKIKRLKESENFHLKSIEIKKSLYKNELQHDLAANYSCIADVYIKMNKFKESENFLLKTIEIYETIHQKRASLDLAESYSKIAYINTVFKRLDESEKFVLKSIKIKKSVYLSGAHSSLAESYLSLAKIYKEIKNLKESEEFRLKSIKIYKQLYSSQTQSNPAAAYLILANIYKEIYRLDINGIKEKCIDSDQNRLYLLHSASKEGHKEIVQSLIEEGIDINQTDNDGKNALHLASEKGHLEVVQLLVVKGIDINQTDSNGQNALHHASSKGHKEITQFLIEKGIGISLINKYGYNALHLAYVYGHKEIIQLLIEKGIDIYQTDSHGRNAFHLASIEGHKEIVEMLIEKGIDINTKSEDGQNALHLASSKGYIEIVQLLIEKRIDINQQTFFRQNALHLASKAGHKEVVKFLIEKGIDINLKDQDGWIALHLASEKGYKRIVQLLIEKGINLNQTQSLFAKNTLNVTFQFDHTTTVQFIENIKTINQTTEDGQNALHLASKEGHKEIVELLIEKGIDINRKDNYGQTALHLASQKGHKEIVELLIKKVIDFNRIESYGRNASKMAYIYGHKKMIRLQIEEGIDINQTNKYRENALHLASRYGHKEIVQLLIEKGIDIKQMNNDGRNALQLASKEGHIEIVELLIDKGININESDNFGQNAFHLASEGGHKEIVELLIEKGIFTNKSPPILTSQFSKSDSFIAKSYQKSRMFEIFSNILYQRPQFIIEKGFFDEMMKYLNESRLLILYGVPGIGKTTNALEYAYRFKERQNHVVLWFDANSKEIIDKFFSELYAHMNNGLNLSDDKDSFKKIADFLKKRLNRDHETKFLVVMNNLELNEKNDDIAKKSNSWIECFLADMPLNVNILITCRNKQILKEYLNLDELSKKLEVNFFTPTQAEMFLSSNKINLLGTGKEFLSKYLTEPETLPLELKLSIDILNDFEKNNNNAIGIHLFFLNTVTKSIRFKLEELILKNNPNGIKGFLNKNYDTHKNCKKTFLNQILLKKLNPCHPKGEPHSPNELSTFDLVDCYTIAKIFLALPDSDENFQKFNMLRKIAKNFYGNLHFLELEKENFDQIINELEIILEQLCPQIKQEIKDAIERIKQPIDIDQQDGIQLKKLLIDFMLSNKAIFTNFNVLKVPTIKFLNKYNEPGQFETISLKELCLDFQSIVTSLKSCTQEELKQFTKAFSEYFKIKNDVFEKGLNKYLKKEDFETKISYKLFNALYKQIENESKDAWNALEYISYINFHKADAIPLSLIKSLVEIQDTTEFKKRVLYPLQSNGLIESYKGENEEILLKVHRLTQILVKKIARNSKKEENILEKLKEIKNQLKDKLKDNKLGYLNSFTFSNFDETSEVSAYVKKFKIDFEYIPMFSVIVGINGIGKTTLLKALESYAKNVKSISTFRIGTNNIFTDFQDLNENENTKILNKFHYYLYMKRIIKCEIPFNSKKLEELNTFLDCNDFKFKLIKNTDFESIDDKFKFVFEGSNGERIFFDDISDGEKVVLNRLLWDFDLKEKTENVLFLYDEPDCHLHPTLVKSVIDSLKRLTELGVQVIITTQNPITLTFINEQKDLFVMDYSKEDKTKIKVKKFDPSETHPSTLLTNDLVWIQKPYRKIYVQSETDKLFFEKLNRQHNLSTKELVIFKALDKNKIIPKKHSDSDPIEDSKYSVLNILDSISKYGNQKTIKEINQIRQIIDNRIDIFKDTTEAKMIDLMEFVKTNESLNFMYGILDLREKSIIKNGRKKRIIYPDRFEVGSYIFDPIHVYRVCEDLFPQRIKELEEEAKAKAKGENEEEGEEKQKNKVIKKQNQYQKILNLFKNKFDEEHVISFVEPNIELNYGDFLMNLLTKVESSLLLKYICVALNLDDNNNNLVNNKDEKKGKKELRESFCKYLECFNDAKERQSKYNTIERQMVQYCNENNIEFLVPKELLENFNYVIDNHREEEIMLFEAYPCLFKYLRDNLNKLEPNIREDNILDYITEIGAFSEKYVPDFIYSNDINIKSRISKVKLIDQIFFPNRYLSSSLHMLFSKKEFPLLQKIKNYIESKINRNFLITLTEKQFEYIFKYHFEFDSISVNIFSDIRYLFSEREQNELTDDQEETIEFFEDFLSDINTNVNKKTDEWKSTKSQF